MRAGEPVTYVPPFTAATPSYINSAPNISGRIGHRGIRAVSDFERNVTVLQPVLPYLHHTTVSLTTMATGTSTVQTYSLLPTSLVSLRDDNHSNCLVNTMNLDKTSEGNKSRDIFLDSPVPTTCVPSESTMSMPTLNRLRFSPSENCRTLTAAVTQPQQHLTMLLPATCQSMSTAGLPCPDSGALSYAKSANLREENLTQVTVVEQQHHTTIQGQLPTTSKVDEMCAIVTPRVHNRKREESVALRICAVFHPWQRFTTFSLF